MEGIYIGLLTLSISLHFLPVHSQSSMTFCDGKKVITINAFDCPAGINFGSKKPECVCISGIYRSWAQDCELYDGFLNGFCSPLTDDNFKTVGIRLVDGISDVNKNTAAIFGYDASEDNNWKAYLTGSEGKTKSDSFYSLNGFPIILAKGEDKFICVEPQARFEKQVCRFFASENKAVWMADKEITIKVKSSCNPSRTPEFQGFTVTQLKEHKCYDIMGNDVSECQLACEGKPQSIKPGNNSTKPPKPTQEPIIDEKMSVESIEKVEVETSSNANFFLHRKLNKYTKLRQVGLIPRPDLSMTAPNRTFSLLDIAKRVVRAACPSTFVSDIFLEQAIELFVIIHMGQDFRFIEDIQLRDYKWIEEILLSCRVSTIESPLSLDGESSLPGCEKDGLIANVCYQEQNVRYCKPTKSGQHHQYGKYHYIVDAVWNIIDVTHIICYPHFIKSFRMFHVWEQASEKLFTRDIRNLWHKPEVDLRVYDALLSHKSMVDMINLERCAEAAYLKTGILPGLVRPSKPKSHFRRKRDAMSQLPSVTAKTDVYCAKTEKDFVYNC